MRNRFFGSVGSKNGLKNGLKKFFFESEGKYSREKELGRAVNGSGLLPKRLLPDSIVKSICGYCSIGCSLDIHMKNGEAINLVPTDDYPVNMGVACPKGWESLTPLAAEDRSLTPYLRGEDGKLHPVDWEKALITFVDRMVAIQSKHGKDSVAFLSTGQITTEEMVYLGSLAKFGMGMKHGDGNTRQCMATSVVAYKEAFGFDAPPYSYQDLEESDVLVFVGSNPCVAHPILWGRVLKNPHDPEVFVIDPRTTETALAASHHLSIAPKSDLILLYAVANHLIALGWIDQDYIQRHTTEFEKFKEFVRSYSLELASQKTEVPIEAIKKLASSIHKGKRVSFWWTMGVNQSHQGVRTAQAIINLALMTGNMGRPGTGANSITGQCNAMGSRLYSNTTNLLGGHQFENAEHRAKVARILNIKEDRIPKESGWAYDQILEGILHDEIKGLWIIATNPVHSWINKGEIADYLAKLDFLVVQDMYPTTETAEVADLFLPAAGWGEKEGTFINSERRFGLILKTKKAPGQSLSDFKIFQLIAYYWGCEQLFEKWKTPEDVFHTLVELSKDQPCDISGITGYSMIDQYNGIQWPYKKGSPPPQKESRLFEDGRFYHPDGRAKFIFEKNRLPPEPVTNRYPFLLLTGRESTSQFHTQTRTGKSGVLRELYPEKVHVDLNIEDAHRLKISEGQRVFVSTRRGKINAEASIGTSVNPGQLFMAMHYPETNELTQASFDPYSRQPSYKICAAALTKE